MIINLPQAKPKPRKPKPARVPSEPRELRKSGRIVGLAPVSYDESALDKAEARASNGGGGNKGKKFEQHCDEMCAAPRRAATAAGPLQACLRSHQQSGSRASAP